MPRYKKISLEQFKSEVEGHSTFNVDLNDLLRLQGVRMCYKTDRIFVVTVFPPMIILHSGENTVSVGIVDKIERCLDWAKPAYRIHCSGIDNEKYTILLTPP